MPLATRERAMNTAVRTEDEDGVLAQTPPIVVGSLIIAFLTRKVFLEISEPRELRQVHLTEKEFSLLAFLGRRVGSSVPYAMIEQALWPGSKTSRSEAFFVHISSIRKKLDHVKPGASAYLVTAGEKTFKLANPASPE